MKEKIIASSLLIVLVISVFISKTCLKKDIKETKGVEVVPTMQDIITSDSSWCPNFSVNI